MCIFSFLFLFVCSRKNDWQNETYNVHSLLSMIMDFYALSDIGIGISDIQYENVLSSKTCTHPDCFGFFCQDPKFMEVILSTMLCFFSPMVILPNFVLLWAWSSFWLFIYFLNFGCFFAGQVDWVVSNDNILFTLNNQIKFKPLNIVFFT